jgi:SAM-dependent methyltransferase
MNQFNQHFSNRNCPNCLTEFFGSKSEMKSKNRNTYPDLDFLRLNFIGLRNEQVFFPYVRCINCGLLFNNVYFSQNELNKLYSQMPPNFLESEPGPVRKTQSSYAHTIKNSGLELESLLEIGADVGFFFDAIKQLYEIRNAILVEPNRQVRTELEKLLDNDSRFKVVNSISEVPTNSRFDLVVAIHVLDHLLDPATYLQQLWELCAEKGNLVLVVHNENSLLRKLLGGHWPPFCLQHPQLYNQKTLKYILAKTKWNVKSFSRTTNWFDLSHFIRLAFRIFGKNYSMNLMPKLYIPLRLGNIICIANKVY